MREEKPYTLYTYAHAWMQCKPFSLEVRRRGLRMAHCFSFILANTKPTLVFNENQGAAAFEEMQTQLFKRLIKNSL